MDHLVKTTACDNASTPSTDLLEKLHATSMTSFGELATIVIKYLGWSAPVFMAQTGLSREMYNKFHAPDRGGWDTNTVLSFCRGAKVGRAVAECLFAAHNMQLNPFARADHRAIAVLLDDYRGKSAAEWNAYLKAQGLRYRVKVPTKVRK